MKRHEMLDPGRMTTVTNAGQIQIVAGGAADGVEQNGPWFSVDDNFGMRITALWRHTLASTETATLAFNVQDATDVSGTGAADFGTAFAADTIGSAGVTTDELGESHADFTLVNSRGFVRVQFTGTLSAGATDTLSLQMGAILSEASLPTAA